jgi:hypothetical protein
MEDLSIKKRKLILNRETVMPLQADQLAVVYGGKDDPNDNLISRAAQSGAISAIGSGVVTALAAESASACAVASGAASAAAATVDHVSNKLNAPCWVATSIGSAAIHFTRKW